MINTDEIFAQLNLDLKKWKVEKDLRMEYLLQNDREVELCVLPTKSKYLDIFLELLSKNKEIETRYYDKKVEYYALFNLTEILDFDDKQLITEGFKNKVVIRVKNEEYLFWQFRDTLWAFILNRNISDDKMITKPYQYFKSLFNYDLPEFKKI